MPFYLILFQCEILNMMSLDVNNGSVHSIQEFFFRQKVKFNAILIEYHGDLGMN